ncbi:hypothetical protein ABT56_10315 [Photobacterium aquae]|uniref:Uncharacterized protein n=1 Tax=Photobacterium aquae TaxID=1195763 RepID=A0A0J1H275_9GAMM|nr:hypothetical protein [Photobacterium aquae]KLV05910.1 hypothetical protein ABT56_10315 [Photobacterium aquae]
MNEWGKGLVLFSALLSPLAMADWLLDVNFELTGSDRSQSVNTSLSLLPGEETVFFGSANDNERELVGRAELLEVSAESVKIAFRVEERLDDGGWRTIIAPTLSTGLDAPVTFEGLDDNGDNQVKLEVAVTTV